MRAPFTDGWNSVWHVVFGFIASYEPMLTPLFIAYEVFTPDDNTLIDLSEFGVGFVAGNLNK
jgi:hypothetical protein